MLHFPGSALRLLELGKQFGSLGGNCVGNRLKHGNAPFFGGVLRGAIPSGRRTHSYQPVLTDIRTIAPTGWYGSPENATEERGIAMLEKIADSITAEATELFAQLKETLGGTGEVKHLRKAG